MVLMDREYLDVGVMSKVALLNLEYIIPAAFRYDETDHGNSSAYSKSSLAEMGKFIKM